MKNTMKTSRRGFIKSTAVAAIAFPSIVPSHVLGLNGKTPPSGKLNVAGIGIGGMGFGDLRSVTTENIVALCDVDHKNAARAFKKWPQATRYKDYREMLDKQKDLDAVIVSTPDHTHAVISVAAMRAGKHVYCQKPLTHDIYESRRVAAVARDTGVVTQMGIQHHATEGPRLICEWLGAGAIGKVTEVDAWCSLSYYPAGHARWSPKWMRLPKDPMPQPIGLDWDTWIGPQAMRPYHRAYHPGTWRAWWDFGTGMMGDRGVHTIDSIMWALSLGAPESVAATCVDNNVDTHPRSAVITFSFAARDGHPPVKMTWYEGHTPPRPEELEDGRLFGGKEGGILFKGSTGKLMTNYTAQSPRIIPEQKMREFLPNRPAKTIPRVKRGHHQQWVRACKGTDKPGADFQYGAALTEICLLGNLAKKFAGTELKWDAANMRVTNLAAANAWVKRPYRDGWSL